MRNSLFTGGSWRYWRWAPFPMSSAGTRGPEAGRGAFAPAPRRGGPLPLCCRRVSDKQTSLVLSECYFVVEYAPAGTESWRELATDITDNDTPIPSDHIRFIDDMTAYVFLWRVFASTTDGGRTWSVWDAREEVPDWKCCNQAY